MQLENNVTETEIGGGLKEKTFSISQESMGLVLEILRSGLYKNPIASICREIPSNGRDANREVGKGQTPIEISIVEPNQLFNVSDLAMVFKDNGPGISEDRMDNVFIQFGASTKRGSNDFTGGFGLGAKTPFAYTDTFSVITIVDGMKYWYQATLGKKDGETDDEGKKGKMTLMHKESTKEENGTSIVVPIKNSNDRRTFEREVFTATFFWDVKPIYKNFQHYNLDSYKITPIFEGPDFKIIKTSPSLFYDHQILIDGIAYEADRNLLNYTNTDLGDGVVCALLFKNGELTIAANRETLQYNDKTKKLCNERWKSLLKTFEQEIEREIETSSDLLEAILKVRSVYKNQHYGTEKIDVLFRALKHNDSPRFTYKKEDLGQYVSHDFKGYRLLTFEPSSRTGFVQTHIDKHLTYPAYLLDLPKSNPRKIETLKKLHANFLVIVPSKLEAPRYMLNNKDRYGQAELDLHVEEIKSNQKKDQEMLDKFNVSPTNISTIPSAKRISSGNYVKKTTLSIPSRTASENSRTVSVDEWASAKLIYDHADKELKLVNSTKVIWFSTKYLSQLYQFSHDLKTEANLAIIASFYLKYPCVLVAKRNEKYFNKQIKLEDALKQLPANEMQMLIDRIFIADKDLDLLNEFAKLEFESTLNAKVTYLFKLTNSSKKMPYFDSSTEMLKALDKLGYKVSKDAKDAEKLVKDIEEKYPLLRTVLENTYSHSPQLKTIYKQCSTYIKAIDNSPKP